jgi:hypothetical protein
MEPETDAEGKELPKNEREGSKALPSKVRPEVGHYN